MSTTSRAKIAALAFGLSLASVPAFAADDQRGHGRDNQDPAANQQQDQNGKGDRDKDRGKHHGSQNQNNGAQNPNNGAPPSRTNKADWQNNGNANGNNANDNVRSRNRWQGNGNGNGNANTNNANDNDRNRDRSRNSGRGNADFDSSRDRNGNWGNDNRRDNNNWSNNNRRNFDFSRYRRNFESPNRFRIGVYHAPRGYYYRRWHFGERLPIDFYARDFWLTDFIEFGLFAPPPGCVWVRYGPDALLIDEETGEIIQVRYDVFYS